MLRSKKNQTGKYVGNSYRSSDRINGLKWNRLTDPEVRKTLQYYQGLLALRRAHSLFRMADSGEVVQRITLLPDTPEEIAAFSLNGEKEWIIAAFNPTPHCVEIALPQGNWGVFVNADRAGSTSFSVLSGMANIDALSAFVGILEK